MQRRKKIIITLAIIAVAVISTIYGVATVASQYGFWHLVNPLPETGHAHVAFGYPEIIRASDQSLNLNISFTLRFSGSLAENVKIETINARYDCSGVDNIREVGVYFPLAQSWWDKPKLDSEESIPRSDGGLVTRFELNSSTASNGTITEFQTMGENPIYFTVAGDYSPILVITYANGTAIPITIEQIKVHVQSEAEVVSTYTNMGLSYALFGFSYVGVVAVLFEIWKEEKMEKPQDEDKDKKIAPTTNETLPETNSPIKKGNTKVSGKIGEANAEANTNAKPKHNKSSP